MQIINLNLDKYICKEPICLYLQINVGNFLLVKINDTQKDISK